MPDTIETLQTKVREFGEQRNWGKFHSPKNIAMALSVEAAELLEIFQWMSEEESRHLNHETLASAESEIADIFMYTLLACEKLGIDLQTACQEKLHINESRFPITKEHKQTRHE